MGKVYTNCSTSQQTIDSDCFQIKKGDTCPIFKIEIIDPISSRKISFQNWEVITYMYFDSFLASDIDSSMTGTITISFYRDINFCQIKVGDILALEDCDQSQTEYMLVESVNSVGKTIDVSRGYLGSIEFDHSKKDSIIVFRIFEKNGYIDSVFEDNPDTVDVDERDYSVIAYQWDTEDTSHKGNYFLYFRVTDGDLVRTFPLNLEGYCIQII